jgi:hypothetical protein
MQGVYELHMWTSALLQPPICKSLINRLPHNKHVVFLEFFDGQTIVVCQWVTSCGYKLQTNVGWVYIFKFFILR